MTAIGEASAHLQGRGGRADEDRVRTEPALQHAMANLVGAHVEEQRRCARHFRQCCSMQARAAAGELQSGRPSSRFLGSPRFSVTSGLVSCFPSKRVSLRP